MICCNACHEWHHERCMDIDINDYSSKKPWICPKCTEFMDYTLLYNRTLINIDNVFHCMYMHYIMFAVQAANILNEPVISVSHY